MELGMGIHGESGVHKLKLLPCQQAIDLAVEQLMVNSRTLNLEAEDNVFLFVNNLGRYLFTSRRKCTNEFV